MFIRSALGVRKGLSVAIGCGLLLIAAVSLAYQFWPQRKPNISMTYYSDDDGQSWFQDSSFKVAPFDHNGKTAVIAEVYTYDNGDKSFCAYLAKYTPAAKKRLETAFADVQSKGQLPNTVGLLHDRSFIQSGMVVKRPGRNNDWLPYSDPRANDLFSIRSPDGSAVDQLFVY
jgi:hypothetical protein